MTQNLHVCPICCRLEVAYDVISGRKVKTIEGYLVVNSEIAEIASSNSFRYITKQEAHHQVGLGETRAA